MFIIDEIMLIVNYAMRNILSMSAVLVHFLQNVGPWRGGCASA